MRKAAGHLSAVIGRVLFIGLSVQAVLGLLWMLFNFASFQEYEKSLFLTKVSESLICDDYTGILYPILIRAARGIASVVPVPYYSLLYLLQLGIGYAAAFFFLKTFLPNNKSRFLICWGAFVLVTVPVAMQCHLAVLPCSLTGSLLLLQTGVFLRDTGCGGAAVKSGARTEVLLGLLWSLEVLLMPEYLWIGILPVLIYAVRALLTAEKKDLQKCAGIVLVAAVFLCVTPLFSGWTAQPGAYGRMKNTPEAALMRRVCGGYLQEYYGYWPRELQDRITQEDLVECMSDSEGIDRVMGREIDSAFEEKTVKNLFREMVRLGWAYSRTYIVKDAALDVLGYGFAPVFSRVCLRLAYYDSYARENYEVMRAKTPRLTYYVSCFGSYCFAVGLGLTAVWQILSRCALPRENARKKKLSGAVFCGVMGSWLCFCCVMQGQGRMDHKNSLAVTVLWFSWMCLAAVKELDGLSER